MATPLALFQSTAGAVPPEPLPPGVSRLAPSRTRFAPSRSDSFRLAPDNRRCAATSVVALRMNRRFASITVVSHPLISFRGRPTGHSASFRRANFVSRPANRTSASFRVRPTGHSASFRNATSFRDRGSIVSLQRLSPFRSRPVSRFRSRPNVSQRNVRAGPSFRHCS